MKCDLTKTPASIASIIKIMPKGLALLWAGLIHIPPF
jgi:hypothetical protein